MSDFILIESNPAESEDALRTWLEELFLQIYSARPVWLEYEIGPLYEFRGKGFRQFKCIAGSVSGMIIIHAGKLDGIYRDLLYWGEQDGKMKAYLISGGNLEQVDLIEISEMS